MTNDVIEWENRPEGATHYRKIIGGGYWIKVEDGIVYYWRDDDYCWQISIDFTLGRFSIKDCIPVPTKSKKENEYPSINSKGYHCLVPVSTSTKITHEIRGDKIVFCKNGVYFALTKEEIPEMHKAMIDASKECIVVEPIVRASIESELHWLDELLDEVPQTHSVRIPRRDLETTRKVYRLLRGILLTEETEI